MFRPSRDRTNRHPSQFRGGRAEFLPQSEATPLPFLAMLPSYPSSDLSGYLNSLGVLDSLRRVPVPSMGLVLALRALACHPSRPATSSPPIWRWGLSSSRSIAGF